MAFLEFNEIECFSHPLRNLKTKKIVLKGSPFMEPHKILTALNEKFENNVLRVAKLTTTKRESSSFLVEIKKSANLGDIRRIIGVCGVIIQWQTFKRTGPTQCLNCMEFGHGSTFCFNKPKYLKCGEGHSTSTCPITDFSLDKAKCARCRQQGHTANYKGCPNYPARQQTNNFPNQTYNNTQNNTGARINSNFTNPNMTYSQATQNTYNNAEHVPNTNINPNNKDIEILNELINKINFLKQHINF